jgi:glycosyltransferase involved in cell wall biosynthesis
MDLSVIIPSFNSEGWIGRTLEEIATASRATEFKSVKVVLVDDGSTDGSVGEAREAAERLGIDLLIHSQPNLGRHQARLAGFELVTGSHVLLIDTRVFLHARSLDYVSARLREVPVAVWTAHVVAQTSGNSIAGFWQGIEHVAWRRYFRQPRHVCFGIDDFDYYPKGTTALIGERRLLHEAFLSFEPQVDDWHKANDDTAVLRQLAASVGIDISPDYSCTYNARTTVKAFLKHAHHRGAVLVDGYWLEGARFRHAISAFLAASLLVPAVAFVVAVLGSASAVLIAIASALLISVLGLLFGARALGASWHDSLVLARYSPLFAVWYGAGIWRGAWLRSQAKARRRR